MSCLSAVSWNGISGWCWVDPGTAYHPEACSRYRIRHPRTPRLPSPSWLWKNHDPGGNSNNRLLFSFCSLLKITSQLYFPALASGKNLIASKAIWKRAARRRFASPREDPPWQWSCCSRGWLCWGARWRWGPGGNRTVSAPLSGCPAGWKCGSSGSRTSCSRQARGTAAWCRSCCEPPDWPGSTQERGEI